MGSILFLSISPNNIKSAGGRISEKYIRKLSHNHHVINVSIGDKDSIESFNSNADCFSFGRNQGFGSKIKRGLYRYFFQHHFVNSTFLFNKCKELISNKEIDAIISVSAPFVYTEVGYLLSTTYSIPHFIIYNDPFVGNVSEKRRFFKRNKSKESLWLANARQVFMPKNYYDYYMFIYGKLMEKVTVLDIPCFPEFEFQQANNNSHDVFYGGTFNNKYRNPKKIRSFFEKLFLFDNKIKLNCYSNLKPTFSNNKNIFVYPLLEIGEYRKEINKAKIILIKDNDYGFQIPSKIFEVLGSKKKILYFTNNIYSPGSVLIRENKNSFIVDESKTVNEKTIKEFIVFCYSECLENSNTHSEKNEDIINTFYKCFCKSLNND